MADYWCKGYLVQVDKGCAAVFREEGAEGHGEASRVGPKRRLPGKEVKNGASMDSSRVCRSEVFAVK